MDRTVGGVLSTSGGVTSGGAMLFVTGVAAKLAREFGCGDAASSMLPVVLVYARLMTSSSSSVPLRVRVTILSLAVIAVNSRGCGDVTGQHKVSRSCRVYCNLLRQY